MARRAGLGALVATKLTVPGGAGCDAAAKECSIVAGMLTGADSIDDLGVLCDAGDGLLHALVHTGGDGELSPGLPDRADHGMVVERAESLQQPQRFGERVDHVLDPVIEDLDHGGEMVDLVGVHPG